MKELTNNVLTSRIVFSIESWIFFVDVVLCGYKKYHITWIVAFLQHGMGWTA
jgi:hypothetical protein